MTSLLVCHVFVFARHLELGGDLNQVVQVNKLSSEYFIEYISEYLTYQYNLTSKLYNITDIEPPKLKGCQNTVYAFADRNSSTGVATWSEPIAEDNHDSSIVVRKEGSVFPGNRLSAGNYKVVYKATDAAGNKAQSCITEVVVKSKDS